MRKMGIKNIAANVWYSLRILFQECRWLSIFEITMNILRGLLPFGISYLEKRIIDELTLNYNNEADLTFPLLVGIVLLIIATRIVYEYLQVLSTKITIICSHKSSVKIQNSLLNKSKTLDRAFFDFPETYDIIQRSGQFDSNVILTVFRTVMEIVRQAITMASAVVILFTFDYRFILLAIITYIPLFFAEKKRVEATHDLQESITELERKQNYYYDLIQNDAYVQEARIYDYSDHFIQEYSNVRQLLFNKKKRLAFKTDSRSSIVAVLKTTVETLFFGYLAYCAIKGQITIGDITFIFTAFQSVGEAHEYGIRGILRFLDSAISIEYFRKFLGLKNSIVTAETDQGKKLLKNGGKHKIEFRDVSFAYPGGPLILQNLSFCIMPGQTVGLVGLNGAGKTTVVKLMLRLYDCTEGEILIDDINIKEYDPSALYGQWGVMFQEYHTYALSIRENIALAQDFVSDEELRRSGDLACVDDFVKKLPKGYDTQLYKVFDDEGYEPSVGQNQRISCARALYKNSEILILDEPSASIDAQTESRLFTNLKELRGEKTTLLISHRLSNIIYADYILVLEGGELVESGSHAQLIAQKGNYEKLFRLQAERYIKGQDIESACTDERTKREAAQ